MRVVRWVVLGGLVVLIGAALGFLASLLKPRTYAEFSGSRQRDFEVPTASGG